MTQPQGSEEIIDAIIAEQKAEYEAPPTDAAGTPVKLDALAVDALPDQTFTAHDDTETVQTTFGSIEHVEE